jgi:hypothetical protein
MVGSSCLERIAGGPNGPEARIFLEDNIIQRAAGQAGPRCAAGLRPQPPGANFRFAHGSALQGFALTDTGAIQRPGPTHWQTHSPPESVFVVARTGFADGFARSRPRIS